MNTVINIEHIWKEYILGVMNHGMLYKDMQSWFYRLFGKADPNSILGYEELQGHFLALRDISLQIESGERIGIIGKNGAGKSTLLKILSRVTAPTRGVIKMRGIVASLLEVGTGFHPELTGRENIYLNGAILGLTKKEITQRIDEIIDFSGIEKFIDTPVKRYSSGMYVRLAFAVAAHLDPDILIVDEVLAVGDMDFQRKSLGRMDDISKTGKTVIFVRHNIDSILKLCDRVIILEKGVKTFDGDTGTGIKKYIKDLTFRGENEYREILELCDVMINGFDMFTINSYRIINQKGDVSGHVIYTGSRYDVQIDLEMIKPDREIRLGYGIYDLDNNLLFNTSSADYRMVQFEQIQSGKYTISIELPVDMLFEGEYYVELLALVEKRGWILSSGNSTRMRFKVLFSGADESIPVDRFGGYHSTIKRKLDWHVH
jgi:lipopolysaccharide transport system ATP-binding protein